MRKIDSQLKKLTLNPLSPMFLGINNNNFSFLVFVFTTLKKKIFIFEIFLALV